MKTYITLPLVIFLSLMGLMIVAIEMNIGFLFLFGFSIGIGMGASIGMMASVSAFNNITRRQTQDLSNGFSNIIESWIEPRIHYVNTNPNLLRATKALLKSVEKLTERAVITDDCGICGGDRREHPIDPFEVEHHQNKCPVPFARKIYKEIYAMVNEIETNQRSQQHVRKKPRRVKTTVAVLKQYPSKVVKLLSGVS